MILPLFKGSGCKSTPDKVLNYIMDSRKATLISSLNLDDSRSYSKQFHETAQLFNKGDRFDERKYYHCKLSCAQTDHASAALHHQYPAKDRITSAERHIELKGGTSWKQELREVISLAIAETTNIQDFEAYLGEYGVTLTRNTDRTIAFKHPKQDQAIRGDRLGDAYTKGAIIHELTENRRINRQGQAQSACGTETTGVGKYPAESSVSAIERRMREISQRDQPDHKQSENNRPKTRTYDFEPDF